MNLLIVIVGFGILATSILGCIQRTLDEILRLLRERDAREERAAYARILRNNCIVLKELKECE